ncbi:MAG: HEPN domain-containing protein [bacterium]
MTGVFFLGHLVIEKVLKAFYVLDNQDERVPHVHNLSKIAEQTKLPLSQKQKILLLEINQFNIRARYPDYKFEFYRKCTPEFTKKYFSKIKELYNWLLQQMSKRKSSD